MQENKVSLSTVSSFVPVATEYEVGGWKDGLHLKATKVLAFDEPLDGLLLVEILSAIRFESGPTHLNGVRIFTETQNEVTKIIVSWEV